MSVMASSSKAPTYSCQYGEQAKGRRKQAAKVSIRTRKVAEDDKKWSGLGSSYLEGRESTYLIALTVDSMLDGCCVWCSQ